MEESIQREDMMPKEQRTFTREFKLEVVQLAHKSGKSQAQIARDLGIAESTLYHWCKEFAQEGEKAFAGSGHQSAQEEELRRVKRELELTRQEREIGKKHSPSFRAARLEVSFHGTASEGVPSE